MRGGRTWSNYIFNVRTRKLGVLRHGGIKEGELRHCRSLQDRGKGAAEIPQPTRQKGERGQTGTPKGTGQKERRREEGNCGTAAVYRTEERGGGNNASYEQKVTNSCKKERFCARLKDECALFYNLLALSRLGITWCGEK